MKKIHLKLIFNLFLFCSLLISCSLFNLKEQDSIKNISTHIIVSNDDTIPETGSYMWGAHLFKMNYTKDVDLAEIDQRLKKDIEAELSQKGYKRVEENPDFLVGYAAAYNTSLNASDFNKAYGEKMAITFPEIAADQTHEYNQGCLIIDVIDARKKKLLWRGAIMAELKEDVSVKTKEKRTKKSIHSLLTQFPKPE